MKPLTKEKRIKKANELKGQTYDTQLTALTFDIPYGTLLSAVKSRRLNGDRVGKKYYINLDDAFLIYCEGYKPMSKEQRHKLSESIKKSHAIKLKSTSTAAESINLKLETVERPVPGTATLTIPQKLGVVQGILRDIADDVRELQAFKDKVEAVVSGEEKESEDG